MANHSPSQGDARRALLDPHRTARRSNIPRRTTLLLLLALHAFACGCAIMTKPAFWHVIDCAVNEALDWYRDYLDEYTTEADKGQE